MMTNDLRKHLRELIASGEEAEALEKLLELGDAQGEELHELILHSSNRYQNLQRKLLIGNISQEEAGVTMAKITQSLLDIVDEIEAPGRWPARRTDISTSSRLKPSRQLKAIMFTDIVGYTALMQQSERAALKYRQKHRRVFEPTTQEYGGQVIQYYGDGTLSIFDSNVAAVRCACSLQRQFQNYPAIPVRIGIHFGEVVLSESDIIGDSVNLASRVESLGAAGSVLISGKVAEEIGNQEDLPLNLLGTFHFKNDKKKREIYAVAAPGLHVPTTEELEGKLEAPAGARRNIPSALPLPASAGRRFWWYSLMALILVFVVGVYLIRSDSDTAAPIPASSWTGKWRQERETTGDVAIKGTIIFEMDANGRLSGMTDDVFPDGYQEHRLLLYKVELSADGWTLNGRYRSEKLPNNPKFNGAFQFVMQEDKTTITGTYDTRENPGAAYYWRGARKE